MIAVTMVMENNISTKPLKNKTMKQTAVEWLFRWLNDNQEETIEEAIEAFEKAKVMERKQIINAYDKGEYDCGYNGDGKQYYNETFKK